MALALLKWFSIVAVQITTPPPPSAEPLHCWTVATGATDEIVVVLVHVPPPPRITAAVPKHLVIVTDDAGVGESVPAGVT